MTLNDVIKILYFDEKEKTMMESEPTLIEEINLRNKEYKYLNIPIESYGHKIYNLSGLGNFLISIGSSHERHNQYFHLNISTNPTGQSFSFFKALSQEEKEKQGKMKLLTKKFLTKIVTIKQIEEEGKRRNVFLERYPGKCGWFLVYHHDQELWKKTEYKNEYCAIQLDSKGRVVCREYFLASSSATATVEDSIVLHEQTTGDVNTVGNYIHFCRGSKVCDCKVNLSSKTLTTKEFSWSNVENQEVTVFNTATKKEEKKFTVNLLYYNDFKFYYYFNGQNAGQTSLTEISLDKFSNFEERKVGGQEKKEEEKEEVLAPLRLIYSNKDYLLTLVAGEKFPEKSQ